MTLTNGPLVEIELDATGSTALSASVRLPEGESCRAAARGRTNPVYAPCGERPLMLRRAREVFPGEDTRRRFFRDAETAPGKLKAPLESR